MPFGRAEHQLQSRVVVRPAAGHVERSTPEVDHLLTAVVHGDCCADLFAELEVLLERGLDRLPTWCDEPVGVDLRHGCDGTAIQASSTIARSVSICLHGIGSDRVHRQHGHAGLLERADSFLDVARRDRPGSTAPATRRAHAPRPRPSCRRGRGPGCRWPPARSRRSRADVVVEVLAASTHSTDVQRHDRPGEVEDRRSAARRPGPRRSPACRPPRCRDVGGREIRLASPAFSWSPQTSLELLGDEHDRQPSVGDLGRRGRR